MPAQRATSTAEVIVIVECGPQQVVLAAASPLNAIIAFVATDVESDDESARTCTQSSREREDMHPVQSSAE